jgi:hypothetical protein
VSSQGVFEDIILPNGDQNQIKDFFGVSHFKDSHKDLMLSDHFGHLGLCGLSSRFWLISSFLTQLNFVLLWPIFN